MPILALGISHRMSLRSMKGASFLVPRSLHEARTKEEHDNFLKDEWRIYACIIFISYTISLMFDTVVILHLKWNKHIAKSSGSNNRVAKKLVLPAFEPFLWCSLFTSLVFAMLSLLHLVYEPDIIIKFVNLHSTPFNTFTVEALQLGRYFISLAVVFTMLQKSLCVKSFLRSFAYATLCSTAILFSAGILAAFITRENQQHVRINSPQVITLNGVLVLAYSYVYFFKLDAHLNGDGKNFIILLVFETALDIIFPLLIQYQYYGVGTLISYISGCIWSTTPYFIWRYFRAETEYWRFVAIKSQEDTTATTGAYIDHQENHGITTPSTSELQLSIEHCQKAYHHHNHRHNSESTCNDSVDERAWVENRQMFMKRLHEGKFGYLLDFTYLTISDKCIGEGKSKVYEGKLFHHMDVAVKVNRLAERGVNEARVLEFAQEAAILTRLSHPNIVDIHGICISPPHLYLVSERCESNLVDYLNVLSAKRLSWSHSADEHCVTPTSFSLSCVENSPVSYFHVTLCMMLDAARAVAYIHGLDPVLLHRDIKARNFLVDKNGMVKLTDFGESCQYSVDDIESFSHSLESNSERIAAAGPDMDRVLERRYQSNRMLSIRGTNEYLAPELIQGKHGYASYERPADIYSLAITLHEISHLYVEKMANDEESHFQLMDKVVNGYRPEIDEAFPKEFRDLLQCSWSTNPFVRPSASEVVQTLESIQRTLHQNVVPNLFENWNVDRRTGVPATITSFHFDGNYAVNCWTKNHFVHSTQTAIRLGNALMDSGYLHHLEHQKAFKNGRNELYTFAEMDIYYGIANPAVRNECLCASFYHRNELRERMKKKEAFREDNTTTRRAQEISSISISEDMLPMPLISPNYINPNITSCI